MRSPLGHTLIFVAVGTGALALVDNTAPAARSPGKDRLPMIPPHPNSAAQTALSVFCSSLEFTFNATLRWQPGPFLHSGAGSGRQCVLDAAREGHLRVWFCCPDGLPCPPVHRHRPTAL
jgi:hypothetical protein